MTHISPIVSTLSWMGAEEALSLGTASLVRSVYKASCSIPELRALTMVSTAVVAGSCAYFKSSQFPQNTFFDVTEAFLLSAMGMWRPGYAGYAAIAAGSFAFARECFVNDGNLSEALLSGVISGAMSYACVLGAKKAGTYLQHVLYAPYHSQYKNLSNLDLNGDPSINESFFGKFDIEEIQQTIVYSMTRSGSKKSVILYPGAQTHGPTSLGKLPKTLFEEGFDVYVPMLPGNNGLPHFTQAHKGGGLKADVLKELYVDSSRRVTTALFERSRYRAQEMSVVGYSMGGTSSVFGMEALGSQPVKKWVLVAPAFKFLDMENGSVLARKMGFTKGPIAAWITRNVETPLVGLFRMTFPMGSSADVIQPHVALKRYAAPEIASLYFADEAMPVFENIVRKGNLPEMHLVASNRDRVVSKNTYAWLEKQMPQVKPVYFESSHALFVDKKNTVTNNEVIRHIVSLLTS